MESMRSMVQLSLPRIRECSDAEEAEWIAGFYGDIATELRRQLAIHDSDSS